MSTPVIEQPTTAEPTAPTPVVAVKRRTIDVVLISFGAVAVVVFAVAGGLLTWGNHFSNDYVHRELASQHVVFPSAAALTAEGRGDLTQWGGRTVDSGSEAQAYAGYINGHLAKVANGATYADLGTPERTAKAAAQTAIDSGQPQATVADLQTKANAITAERTTLFQGETLRGLLLSAYAWSTVGMIAGIAAIGAFVAAGVMLVLVVLGIVHYRKVPKTT